MLLLNDIKSRLSDVSLDILQYLNNVESENAGVLRSHFELSPHLYSVVINGLYTSCLIDIEPSTDKRKIKYKISPNGIKILSI